MKLMATPVKLDIYISEEDSLCTGQINAPTGTVSKICVGATGAVQIDKYALIVTAAKTGFNVDECKITTSNGEEIGKRAIAHLKVGLVDICLFIY